jgi:hypothetical protein
MTFHHAGAQRHRHRRRHQSDLVAGVADRHFGKFAPQGLDDAQIQFVRLTRIGAGAVHDDQVLAPQYLHSLMNLFHRGHAGREDDGFAGAAHIAQQVVIGQRGGRNLVGRGVELFHEIHRRFVPDRDQPGDVFRTAIALDFLVLCLTEFDLAAVLQVGNVSPGRLAHLLLLVGRRTNFRGALLELDRVHAGLDGGVDHRFGNFQVAVVVDADFGDDEGRMAIANQAVPDFDFTSHFVSLWLKTFLQGQPLQEA